MMINSSGPYDPEFASKFGIASFDWSSNKANWAQQNPMNCEEDLVSQAALVAAQGSGGHVFSYFNLVKALPWYTSVREKLEDPAYSGFFLKFKPGGSLPNGSYYVPNCDTTFSPPLCSAFYHDQEQTPAVPSPSNPNPDGSCVEHCYVGNHTPVGEYLWDHRNGSMLRSFLINDVLLGPSFLGSGIISGMFIDDFWCSNLLNGSGACTDPVQGPTEIDAHSQADMGLSDTDILNITQEWLVTMTAAQTAILQAGGYTWSLIPGQDNANAMPRLLTPGNCAASVRPACNATTSPWQTAPLLWGLQTSGGNATTPFPQVNQDVAAFLLMRGPHAYLGYGQWGMVWPDFRSTPRPAIVDQGSFGVPLGACVETSPNVFTRQWSAANITLDCNTFTAIIPGW